MFCAYWNRKIKVKNRMVAHGSRNAKKRGESLKIQRLREMNGGHYAIYFDSCFG